MMSENLLSIGEAAKRLGVTTETLRHYDRVGLVRPTTRDASSGYRFYTEEDIVRLGVVRALQSMDLRLAEIKQMLEYDDLQLLVSAFDRAEAQARRKIAELEEGIEKIRRARQSYEAKTAERETGGASYVRTLSERVILLSDELETPTVDNLYNYLSHFYDRLPPEQRGSFDFEDLAGVYTSGGASRLFALCRRHGQAEGLRRLPAGRWLCVPCSAAERESALTALRRTAREKYSAEPTETVQLIVITGILKWDYQLQVYLGE